MEFDRRKYDGLTEEQKLDKVLEKLDQLESAFPFGIEHHKNTHEQMQQTEKAERDFIRDLKLTLAKNSIIAFIFFILSAALLGFAAKWSSFVKGL
jgi:hypothetical protein